MLLFPSPENRKMRGPGVKGNSILFQNLFHHNMPSLLRQRRSTKQPLAIEFNKIVIGAMLLEFPVHTIISPD